MKKIVLALAAAATLATSASAVTVINGSFETGIALPDGSEYVPSPDTVSITGWRVLPTGVNYVDSSVWDAQSGSRSVELNGVSIGGVSQQFYNVYEVGRTYRINFWLSANPLGANGDYKAIVSATGGGPQTFTYTKTADNSATNMLYQRYTYLWTPAAVNGSIAFRTNANALFGPVLDSVSVSLVPEPSTWALLLAGFGLTGFAMRRRRSGVVTA